ncbi:helix-turn-helix transcriptional regulator [Frigidibacter mobilis]|uniref:helix-turn-helix transcriptional regulator n=1 Tax=Frigidibacter mobilis TaxID=1335048 RepID=UPI0008366700|nr:LuxR C-terminal-related transcriptional regulator [Frigidibacter mobilis]
MTDVVWNTVRSAVEVYIRRGDTSRAFLLLERCRLTANERGLKRLGILIRLGTEVFAMGSRTSTSLGIGPLPSDEDLVFLPNQNRAIRAERELLEASRFLRDGKLGLAERQARKALTNFAAIRDQRGEIRAQCTLAATIHLMGDEKQAIKRMVDANLQAQQLGAFRSLENRRHFLRVISPTAKAFLGQKADQVSIAGKTAHELTISRLPLHIYLPDQPKANRVLQHAALGLSNKEIAARLHVTEDTVKWHFRRILSSLNASNRTEAVLIARSKGLI